MTTKAEIGWCGGGRKVAEGVWPPAEAGRGQAAPLAPVEGPRPRDALASDRWPPDTRENAFLSFAPRNPAGAAAERPRTPSLRPSFPARLCPWE